MSATDFIRQLDGEGVDHQQVLRRLVRNIDVLRDETAENLRVLRERIASKLKSGDQDEGYGLAVRDLLSALETSAEFREQEIRDDDSTVKQRWTAVLEALSLGQHRTKHIAATTGLSKSAVSTVLRALEKRGLIKRTHAPENADKRSHPAYLTVTGKRLVRRQLERSDPLQRATKFVLELVHCLLEDEHGIEEDEVSKIAARHLGPVAAGPMAAFVLREAESCGLIRRARARYLPGMVRSTATTDDEQFVDAVWDCIDLSQEGGDNPSLTQFVEYLHELPPEGKVLVFAETPARIDAFGALLTDLEATKRGTFVTTTTQFLDTLPVSEEVPFSIVIKVGGAPQPMPEPLARPAQNALTRDNTQFLYTDFGSAAQGSWTQFRQLKARGQRG